MSSDEEKKRRDQYELLRHRMSAEDQVERERGVDMQFRILRERLTPAPGAPRPEEKEEEVVDQAYYQFRKKQHEELLRKLFENDKNPEYCFLKKNGMIVFSGPKGLDALQTFITEIDPKAKFSMEVNSPKDPQQDLKDFLGPTLKNLKERGILDNLSEIKYKDENNKEVTLSKDSDGFRDLMKSVFSHKPGDPRIPTSPSLRPPGT